MVIASRAAVTRYTVGEEVYRWLLHDSQQSKQHAHPRWAAFRLTRTAALGAARLRAAGDPTSSPSLGRRPGIRGCRATASRRQVGNSLAVLGWGRVAGRANWINTPRRFTERWWSSSLRMGGGTVCQVVLDPTVRYEAWLQLVLGDQGRRGGRPLPSGWLDHHTSTPSWRTGGFKDGNMNRKRAGDETNRALVAYVRNLSDEEPADLLVSLDPKVYQDLLERTGVGCPVPGAAGDLSAWSRRRRRSREAG
jgi:hypothetical protein